LALFLDDLLFDSNFENNKNGHNKTKNFKLKFMKKMNPVVHFEMPVEDSKRMANFYTNVFGWHMQIMGPEMGNYVLASTIESDEKGRPKAPGGINGGFFPKKADTPGFQHPSVVIAVDDIKETIKQVNSAGGKTIGETVEIPGVGLFIAFTDTEGNRVSLLQPKMP
jgi:uncharacterized protein